MGIKKIFNNIFPTPDKVRVDIKESEILVTSYGKNPLYIWEKGDDHKLSEHFSSAMFECSCSRKDCILQCISKDLVDKIEMIQSSMEDPIVVISGYRCISNHESLKKRGMPSTKHISTHVYGRAVDIKVLPMYTNNESRMKATFSIRLSENFKCIGTDKNCWHIDMRTDKERKWDY